MTRRPLIACVLAIAVATAACSPDIGVTATRSEATGSENTSPPFEPNDPSTDPTDPTQPADPDETPSTSEPDTTPTTVAEPPVSGAPFEVDADAVNFGPNKPAREYDDFLLATLSDLDDWWSVIYPEIYGEPWEPLQGDVYAAYPERPDDLPGCGTPRTSYVEVQEFVAFYCGVGDFIVYDDGEDGLLAGLADNFGASTIGIVLAHEFGHAIQQRSGVLDQDLPTVTSEQQADCFAGAWAGRASRNEGGIPFTDTDVRSGLIAMLEVRDPAGIDQLTPGGHGSGFDRVGAFQTGFVEGPARCATIIDDPLPLMPNQFNDRDDQLNNGNAEFGYEDDQLLGFLVDDLNLYWGTDAEITSFTPLTLVPVQTIDEVECADLESGFDLGAALCPSTDTVYLNEPVALDLYVQTASATSRSGTSSGGRGPRRCSRRSARPARAKIGNW